ncbi:hypothetical protein EW145_g8335, partial [Phellinidium pouzarii]
MLTTPTVSFPYRQYVPSPRKREKKKKRMMTTGTCHRRGGFESIKYQRNLPIRGPSGAVVLAGVIGVCAYGIYRLGQGNVEKRELEREKVWGRIHLVPAMVAEGDRDTYRRRAAAVGREAEIMKTVEGWEAGKSVYHAERENMAHSLDVDPMLIDVDDLFTIPSLDPLDPARPFPSWDNFDLWATLLWDDPTTTCLEDHPAFSLPPPSTCAPIPIPVPAHH